MEKSKTDAEIIDAVLKATGNTPYSLTEKMNYKSHNSIYSVVNGARDMSEAFKAKLKQALPLVNDQFLETGEGSVIYRPYEKSFTNTDLKELHKIRSILMMPEEILHIRDRVEVIENKIDTLIELYSNK